MPAELPAHVTAALDAPVFAHVATLMPDGAPQSSIMWIHRDGGRIVVNSAEGRVKIENLRRDPRVAVSFSPPDEPYRNVSIRGRAVEFRHDNGDAMIDMLARKYLGADSYPFRNPAETRVTVYIEADSVSG